MTTWWTVGIPIVGQMSICVEAESQKDAIEKAWTAYNKNGPSVFDVEWDAVPAVSTGNVLHAPVNNEWAHQNK